MRPQRHWTVHLVHHTHLDIGYTDPQGTVLAQHLSYLDSCLDLVSATDGWPDCRSSRRRGVRLALHPDDPPVPSVGGVGRAACSVDALVALAEDHPGPAFGIDLCLGTVSEMGGQAAVLDAVRRLGERRKIVYVHLRDVAGSVPRCTECFLGEGNYDPLTVVRELHRVGSDGFLLDDHVPQLTGDTDWMQRGRAHAIGYLQALVHAVRSEPATVPNG